MGRYSIYIRVISKTNIVQFTQVTNLPLWIRCIHFLRRNILTLLGYPLPSRYVRRYGSEEVSGDGRLALGYLLTEYIESTRGEMLSKTWAINRDDVRLRTNFFRDLSRIFLSLARNPLPKIGSFTIDNNGVLSLTNRPLQLEIQDLENERIPTDIPRDYTYSTVDSYVADILQYHDSRIRHQPNAINDSGDYLYQISALTAMRAISPLLLRRDLRRGPYIFMLTDIHQSNIFVNKDWNITSLVDLEWACSIPVEMVQPPYWLTDKAVDQLVSEEYNESRLEFMNIFADVEEETFNSLRGKSQTTTAFKLSTIMEETWQKGTFWFTLALFSPTGLFSIFEKQIQPLLTKNCPDHDAFHEIMPWYWSLDIISTLKLKTADKKKYDKDLQQAFENGCLTD